MKFCQDHWDRLLAAIEERGLSDLIAPDGETAMAQMADQIKRGQEGEPSQTPANYDPLMSAHWAIVGNIGDQLGPNMAYLMFGDDSAPEDPVEGYPGAEGRTWPRCPLCYINLAHELTCTDTACKLDREHGYDWMITRAADDQVERVAELRAGEQS